MDKKHKKTLFVFRRDLRLSDNTALNAALKESEKVIPCFIFDPRQINNNEYKSENAIQFLIESIDDLCNELKKKNSKLYIFYGKAEEVIDKLIKQENLEAVYINKDYTPFSVKRDRDIEKVCNKHKVIYKAFDDVLLNKPGSIFNKSRKPYTVFTPFFKHASTLPVNIPKSIKSVKFFTGLIKLEYKKDFNILLSSKNSKLAFHGGRKKALLILKSLSEFKEYEKVRDFLKLDATTHLSSHLKFGTVSTREVYYAIRKSLGANHPLIRQLYWRDFFYHIAFHFPYVFGNPFYKKYGSLKWFNKKSDFENWCNGKTGFPIVDAGMIELNTTGYMHNRVRMIVASFLTKDLHIDWRLGEKYFAQNLIDYDPCVNNGNWQWVASTGCDAQPYFRIFNPWRQQERFDPECNYIKHWIPELKRLQPKQIHSLYKNPINVKGYVLPIVSHEIESKISKRLYAKAARN